MPANLVRCAVCRALLNSDLKPRMIYAPDFAALPEVRATIDAAVKGYFINCPQCQQVLRVASQFVGKHVECKHCAADFHCHPGEHAGIPCDAVYLVCPKCRKELRAAEKYIGERVACKYCGEGLRITEPV
jgi:uncharacterized protein (DUF983 family)